MRIRKFIPHHSYGAGFTLIEVLIAIAIIILLLVFVFINLRGQSARAHDLKRKTDLYQLRKAFEDYLNDHDGYPSNLGPCGDTGFAPYVRTIPCDPQTKESYGYFPAGNGGFRLCTKLSDTTDPAIAAQHCDGPEGCGVGSGYNYCEASGVTASAVGTADQITGGGGGGSSPTATPTPTPIPTGAYACTPPDAQGISHCNHYSDPDGSGCPVTYADSLCNNVCETGGAAYWCER